LLHVADVHAETVAETALHLKGNFLNLLMACGNALVGNGDLWEVRVLEEAVVWVLSLAAEEDCGAGWGVESASVALGLLALLKQ
jgi:hypothetical protein